MRASKKVLMAILAVAITASANAQSPREQLQQMVEELRSRPTDNALRERVIRLGAEIKPLPAIPEEARRAFVRGNTAMSEANSSDGYSRAARLYEEASTFAPWWADPYFNLAKAREQKQDFDSAIRALRFYLLAGVSESEAREAQDRIYMIEEKIENASRVAKAKEAERRERARYEWILGVWQAKVSTFYYQGNDRYGREDVETVIFSQSDESITGVTRDQFGQQKLLRVANSNADLRWYYFTGEQDGYLPISVIVSDNQRTITFTVKGCSFFKSKGPVCSTWQSDYILTK